MVLMWLSAHQAASKTTLTAGASHSLTFSTYISAACLHSALLITGLPEEPVPHQDYLSTETSLKLKQNTFISAIWFAHTHAITPGLLFLTRLIACSMSGSLRQLVCDEIIPYHAILYMTIHAIKCSHIIPGVVINTILGPHEEKTDSPAHSVSYSDKLLYGVGSEKHTVPYTISYHTIHYSWHAVRSLLSTSSTTVHASLSASTLSSSAPSTPRMSPTRPSARTSRRKSAM